MELGLKQQQHVFKILNAAEIASVIANGNVPFETKTNFPIKLLKVNFCYTISADALVNIVVSCDALDGDILGSLGKYQYTDAANALWFSDGFKASNQFVYLFEKPKYLNGNLILKFQNLLAANIATANIVVHIEFWG